MKNKKIIILCMIFIIVACAGYFRYSQSVVINRIMTDYLLDCKFDSTVIIIDTTFSKLLNYNKTGKFIKENSEVFNECYLYYVSGDQKGDFDRLAQKMLPFIKDKFKINNSFRYISLNIVYAEQKYGLISVYVLVQIPIIESKNYNLPQDDTEIQTYEVLLPTLKVVDKYPVTICYEKDGSIRGVKY